MRFNEPEVLWIFKAISDRDRYRIAVDNDYISIDECIDEKNDEWDSVYVFDNYGQDLIFAICLHISWEAVKYLWSRHRYVICTGVLICSSVFLLGI